MPTITRDQVKVPADVMPEARETYIDNYMKATRGTGRLMLFACDQKIEHLNKDFYGEGIDISDAEPEHLFEIGSQGTIGVLAGQRGLVAQYASDYPEINYLIKMNSKTNLVKTAQEDPYSPQLYDLDAVLAMRENGVKGTFNLNSGLYAPEGTVYPAGQVHRRMTERQCLAAYAGSDIEVAVHASTHAFLEAVPTATAMMEVISDRAALEKAYGCIVRGMAYPFGTLSDDVVEILRLAGIAYSRTTVSRLNFDIPTDWLRLGARIRR